MGMYTEFIYAVNLKKDTPNNVIEILKYMTSNYMDEPKDTPNHSLFGDTRWRYMLNSDSYYFYGNSNVSFKYDKIGNEYNLTIRTNFKNYCNEIKLFLDWIHDYVAVYDGEFLGYYRYEEDEHPTLIYWGHEAHIFKNIQ